ncbi:hypothetical protein A3C09_00040 [Candidatus Uhrbacteria bacterium RIFCSPHIGHO2_02_FULL_47_44]|uniref:Phosphoribosyltransferase domain-containing protein n=1 Tax=Candidatus Uhrbacteria bacterium RIFCSPLOWO2_02_FULL_48_18 TaxID=1802408 RepID=A0A1F7V7W9_9BACT|nr:MAG: hypothetical protein A2839_02775 [Candidatus Uhrbacteria bacterium RIFCSPHIGHO2_01_FULL_47_10]OGL70734.1 MAG: hypothetical protein A3C09_00040 [Candidatus Uhrbacteria bacterium RIFCSPHIGHO2_02_FULL_47_44]OGL76898.1 MAG: hypothetical protein A3E97_04410 [Candidatus Uhrbacteria bacterium RIFCSPHIGHO2_12_FULL_47_12]OGL80328.1 MAG: hypothetical protein A3B20_02785 [Candidatus Uhrbacteria bacterium RIFCSPLOWO2_01_FULL_47_17]OGL86187.1 MAG: hypothetical protein A3I41_01275 [Candidatus Uhrbact
MVGGFGKMAIDALFPRFCLSCKREGQIFCLACASNWIAQSEPFACPFCGIRGSARACLSCREGTYLDGLVSYAPYGNPIVREAIGHWKYDGDRSVESTLRQWIEQSRDRLHIPLENFVVTHVPIHASRKRMRGFDQAEVLSGWVGEMFEMPVETLLVRSHKTKPQAKMQHEKRRVGTLDGIFEIHPNALELPTHILLCDDVFTSGATMDAAAKCLKDAGVEEVWGLVVARGGKD